MQEHNISPLIWSRRKYVLQLPEGDFQICIFTAALLQLWSWGASVSIMSDFRLDDLGLIPGRGKGFFLKPVCPDQL
jgi:hypothetical protein